jgi:hypothetical protein
MLDAIMSDKTTGRAQRDAWLRMADAALLRECTEERYKSGGPGGQRRNKVETALRVRHNPTGVIAKAEESRYLHSNRAYAARRVREKIAIEVRSPFDVDAPELPPELIAQRGEKGRLAISQKNPAYPLIVAVALDALAAAGGSFAKAAKPLGVTTSQLLKLLQSDAEVWRHVDETYRRDSQ